LANDEGDDDDHHDHRGLRRLQSRRPDDTAEAAAKAVLPAEQVATKTDLIELKIELIRTMWLQAGIIIGALSLIFGGIATLIKVL
jgi:hypothetical protein